MIYPLLRLLHSWSLQRFFVHSLFFFLPFLMMVSCVKDKPVSLNEGKITLSSQTFVSSPNFILGYSFEKQIFFKSTATGSEIDIYMNELLVPNGDLAGVQLSTNTISGSIYGFYKTAVFADLNSAENFYQNYIAAVAPVYVTLSDTIEKYDVYTFRTWKTNYVKFIVTDLRVINKGDSPDYIEVDMKYFIQRDGSVNLAN